MKTKISRAILLASVSLLSVICAAAAFSSNRSSGCQLLESNVEALASGEGIWDDVKDRVSNWDRKDWDLADTTSSITVGLNFLVVSVSYDIPVNTKICIRNVGKGRYAHCVAGVAW